MFLTKGQKKAAHMLAERGAAAWRWGELGAIRKEKKEASYFLAEWGIKCSHRYPTEQLGATRIHSLRGGHQKSETQGATAICWARGGGRKVDLP